MMRARSFPKLALYQAELRSDGPRRQGFLRVPGFPCNCRMGKRPGGIGGFILTPTQIQAKPWTGGLQLPLITFAPSRRIL